LYLTAKHAYQNFREGNCPVAPCGLGPNQPPTRVGCAGWFVDPRQLTSTPLSACKSIPPKRRSNGDDLHHSLVLPDESKHLSIAFGGDTASNHPVWIFYSDWFASVTPKRARSMYLVVQKKPTQCIAVVRIAHVLYMPQGRHLLVRSDEIVTMRLFETLQ